MSTIPENLLAQATGDRTVRIAICGGANSGKTVFLTSLLNHLLAHTPDFAPDGWKIVDAHLGNSSSKEFPRFPYEQHRASFVQEAGGWPEKTHATSLAKIVVKLERSEKLRWLQRQLMHSEHIRVLELLDLPGERIADFSMYDSSYVDWCKRIQQRYLGSRSFADYLDRCQTVLTKLSSENIDRIEAEVLSAYRDFLCSELFAFAPLISPSICVLSKDGNTVPSKHNLSPSEIRSELNRSLLGVDESSPFSPLPPDTIKENPLAERFKKRYLAYRKDMVDPIVSWLADVDKFCYLVDVLGTLQDGPAAYNSVKRAGEEVLDLFPTLSWLEKKTNLNITFPLDEFFLVATKADCVLPDEGKGEIRGNLTKLLNKMLKTRLDRLEIEKNRCFCRACAAVKTTVPSEEEEDMLDGWFVAHEGEKPQYRHVKASRVPPDWPEGNDWPSIIDQSHNFVPGFPEREDDPPKQIGLDWFARKFLK